MYVFVLMLTLLKVPNIPLPPPHPIMMLNTDEGLLLEFNVLPQWCSGLESLFVRTMTQTLETRDSAQKLLEYTVFPDCIVPTSKRIHFGSQFNK